MHRPPSSFGSSSFPRRRRRAFALLIVLTLIGFLVLLLVGLATYTRIETAVAGNTQRQAQARQNALLGLQVALGQLQQYAGPDKRVTATAAAFPNVPGTAHYTGVWDSDPAATATPDTPLTWLVSGNEVAKAEEATDPLAITPAAAPTGSTVELVGRNTSDVARDVVVPLVDITSAGVPGQAFVAGGPSTAPIGRYGWWVGDQGVKAPVAVPDSTDAIAFAPYDTAEVRDRIRQQISLGAGAASGSDGSIFFESRDANNATLVANQKINATSQLAFLRTDANAAVGLTRVQQNLHAWSPNNFAVLANTRDGGLRQDLSLKPELLGDAFASWANYAAYMETPGASTTEPAIVPAYGSEPLRRRYSMRAPVVAAGVQHTVAPVLNYFLLTFNVRTQNGSTATVPLQARARWMFSLWNPFTSALVPENLRLEITGLPTVQVIDDALGATLANVPLDSLYGDPLKINLPWDSTGSSAADYQSWLPGRVYTWTALEDTSSSVPSAGFQSKFYSRNLSADAGQGVQQSVASPAIDGDITARLNVGAATTLRIALYAVRADGDVLLATFVSPRYEAFETTPQQLSRGTYQFSYVFRLAESLDTPTAPETWLLGARRDPRRPVLPSSAFVAVPNGPQPELYPGFTTISATDRLLNRANDSVGFDEDVPLFELPRGPILSLGALQHLSLVNHRSFGVGNSWGRFDQINDITATDLFDRFFFSGLTAGTAPPPENGLVLPNPLMRPLRSGTGTAVTLEEFQQAPDAKSSKFLLQGGAFNLNSTNAAAWVAVLRGVRFPSPHSFRYLDADAETGTADDSVTATTQSGDAHFFRYSLSAQETYKAGPDDDSISKTKNFRQGMRSLTDAQVAALAGRIVALIQARHTALGPFRSMDEFLRPLPDSIVEEEDAAVDDVTAMSQLSQSLLERAIATADINVDAAGVPMEFSSQYLTQADIMTALAPVLFPRSDTFVIRAYGEAVNPTTAATEGRAWCEATVQRVPDYFDLSQPAETAPADLNPLNQRNGRRFKIVSFRWLTRSDI